MADSTIPNSFPRTLFSLFLFAVLGTSFAADDSFKQPDSLILKNGKVVKGLIIKNSKDAVLMQEKTEEMSYPKSEIIRINDNANGDILYTDINRKGDLPSWRVIVNDLRTNDAVKSLEEIPATLIDNGEFKNVPYISFRVNQEIELNIYGDPEDPAGIEMGVYGWKSGVPKLRKMLRGYLAGFLTTRQEISTLYSLNLRGGIADAGDLTIEITPRNAPDAYGAWWISLYYKKELAQVRLNDAEYAKLTRPFDEVMDKRGHVIDNGWTDSQMSQSQRVDENGRVLLRGFYRDENGVFRLITDPVPKAKQNPKN